MIHSIAVVIFMALCYLPAALWESIGPYRGNIETMAVAPSDDNTIYCATYSPSPAKIFKSIDGGETWNATSSLTTYCLAIDPTNPDIVYGGAYNAAYKSTDGGFTWTTYPVMDCNFYSISVHPTSPSVVFASGQVWESQVGRFVMGFLKSIDGGVNWTTFPLNTYSGYAYCLVLDPSNPEYIYVGGCYTNPGSYPSVFKSTDGGKTFTEVSTGLPAGAIIYSLAIHPTSTTIIYAGTSSSGIYRSTDSGDSWVQMCTYSDIHALSTSAAEPNIAYAGGIATVYKTTDAGESWIETGTGISGKSIKGLAVKQTQATTVYAANNLGFYKTINGADNWLQSSYGINLAHIPDFDVAPSSTSTIYAVGIEGPWSAADVWLYKTTNSGSEWYAHAVPLSCGDICAVAVSSADPDAVLVLEGEG
ncbi:hypothetical protein AYK25_08855 [Thermoplasmatales archaeon SM1-50]|nr:MAG: hypothetical protein AYK25_08855 [Thermoplasmatales archaeon SM1-50]